MALVELNDLQDGDGDDTVHLLAYGGTTCELATEIMATYGFNMVAKMQQAFQQPGQTIENDNGMGSFTTVIYHKTCNRFDVWLED